MRNPKAGEVILGCLALLLVFILLAILGGVIFTLLWNAVVPSVFGGPTLSFVQGTALMFLSEIVIGSARTVVTTK